MPKNELQLNEKRWQRKRFFHKKRVHLARVVVVLGFLIVLAALAWWFEYIPFGFPGQEV